MESKPTKGKVAVKGRRQIYDENRSTLLYYGLAVLISLGAYLGIGLYRDTMGGSEWAGLVVAGGLAGFALLLMLAMSRAKFDSSGKLVDAGTDINDEQGFGEYAKDTVILTTFSAVIALFWTRGWLFLLLLPIYGGYRLFSGALWPILQNSGQAEASAADQDDGARRGGAAGRRKEKIVYRR